MQLGEEDIIPKEKKTSVVKTFNFNYKEPSKDIIVNNDVRNEIINDFPSTIYVRNQHKNAFGAWV